MAGTVIVVTPGSAGSWGWAAQAPGFGSWSEAPRAGVAAWCAAWNAEAALRNAGVVGPVTVVSPAGIVEASVGSVPVVSA